MTLYFSNPGDFDIRLLSTFGVSAKPSSTNPIGKFGTGLKNAVAGVLRLGGTVTIHSPSGEYTIFAKKEDFRGTEHEMVWMQGDGAPQPLSFSTALGRHWEPWMIYREFFCNAKDEGGGKPTTVYPAAGGVVFCITCPAIEAILHQHSSFFIEGKPFTRIGHVEIYPGQTNHIYFKGILVHQAEKPFLFTYNFLSGLTLTEDRTVQSWDVRYELSCALLKASEADRPLIKSILLVKDTHMESFIDYESSWASPSAPFKEEVCALARTHRANLVGSAQRWAKKHIPEDVEVETIPFTTTQLLMLEAAKEKLQETLSIAWNYPLFLSPEVSENQLGMVVSDKVYLNSNTFANERTLFSTLLEEHIHLSTSHRDFTREFQEDLHNIIQQLVFGKL